MAPLTHTPAFLLQLKHIKGKHGEAAALTPVPMAAIHLQRQKKARGLITRHTFPESLKGDEVNLLVPLSSTQPARVSPRSPCFSSESRDFHEMPGLVMGGELCLQVLPKQQSGLKRITDLKEGEMICE